MDFQRVEQAIADLKAGKMIIMNDDEDRENEGDLVIAAEKITPEVVNFMAMYGRGLICLTVTEKRAKQLKLSQMTQENTASFGTAFTISRLMPEMALRPGFPRQIVPKQYWMPSQRMRNLRI